ncbi:hypothetical protein JRQ81_008180 [Phrynocephalus forsythii]|uniref:Uncharacterized protein n=1 Tax=Phrynocephalus forsythii TaxID=171643 RepID=A0A9Q1AT77_9SAUR|nr:hypothetical protein JRQ81_008180 [Phrynocephalus forsythii]
MEFPSKSENPIRTHGRNGAWKMSSPKKFMRTKGFRRLQMYTNMIVNACPKNTKLTNKPKIWRTVKESIAVFTTRKGFAMQKEAKQSILKIQDRWKKKMSQASLHRAKRICQAVPSSVGSISLIWLLLFSDCPQIFPQHVRRLSCEPGLLTMCSKPQEFTYLGL